MNSKCPQGAANKQAIDDLQRRCENVEGRVTDLERSLRALPWTLFTSLIAMVGIIVTLIKLFTDGR